MRSTARRGVCRRPIDHSVALASRVFLSSAHPVTAREISTVEQATAAGQPSAGQSALAPGQDLAGEQTAATPRQALPWQAAFQERARTDGRARTRECAFLGSCAGRPTGFAADHVNAGCPPAAGSDVRQTLAFPAGFSWAPLPGRGRVGRRPGEQRFKRKDVIQPPQSDVLDRRIGEDPQRIGEYPQKLLGHDAGPQHPHPERTHHLDRPDGVE